MTTSRTIVVAIDFGLTYTGFAFSCPWLSSRPDDVVAFRRWPSHSGTETADKSPSVLSYPEHNPRSQKNRWGYQVQPGMTSSSWNKFTLDDEASRELLSLSTGPWARAGGVLWTPNNKTPIEVFADFLREVYQCVMRAVASHVAKVTRGNHRGIPVEFWLTVPGAWSETAKARTQEAAIMADFDRGLGGLPSTINLVSEPQAAMTDIIAKSSPVGVSLWPGDAVLVCDCGGGTTDVATYYIEEKDPYSYHEINGCSGTICGATTVQRALYSLMIERFGGSFTDAPLSLRAPGSSFMTQFERCMAEFDGSNGSDTRLPLSMNSQGFSPNWYNSQRGQVRLTNNDLRHLFHPTLNKICLFLSRQVTGVQKQGYQINKIFLVGGFSLCPYVYSTISNKLAGHGRLIVHRPEDPQLSTVRGAVIWGSGALRPATRVSPCHYGIESSLAENSLNNAEFHFLSSISTGRAATNAIKWLVTKGDRYVEGNFEDSKIILVHKDGDSLTKVVNVYSSTLDTAPCRLDQTGVSLAMPVMCDISCLNLEWTFQREVNGCTFFPIECDVRVILGQEDGLLHFDVATQNQIISDGEVGLSLR